jgi:hypothetical protein
MVSGTVVDNAKQPIAGAVILDENGHVLADTTQLDGAFYFKAVEGSRFGVEVPGYELKWRTVRAEMTHYRVLMDVKSQTMESVVITRRNSEEALDIKNVNIIHYQPLDGAILTLKKEKRTYYLGMDSLQKEGGSFPLNIDRPTELFFDCFRNAYVLSADSAYQFIMLDSGLIVLPPIALNLFNHYIRPCVAKFDQRLVMEELSSLNKEYALHLYENESSKEVFHRFDELGYQAAFEASLAMGQNVDPNNGDTLVDPIYLRRQMRRDVYGRNETGEDFKRALVRQDEEARFVNMEAAATYKVGDSLQPLARQRGQSYFGSTDAWRNSRNWIQAMAAYRLFTQPVDIKTFQMGNFLAVVDYDSNAVHVLDHQGHLIKSSYFEVEGEVKRLIQDRATEQLFLYTKDRANHKVFGLDPFTGRVSYLKNFGGMPHAKQAIIYDGYLYYKVLERDFYGINRVLLPKVSPLAYDEP